jgi:hypothetical protein
VTARRALGPAQARAAEERGQAMSLATAWHRIRLTAAEMNYAARRVVELQAPWSVDGQ